MAQVYGITAWAGMPFERENSRWGAKGGQTQPYTVNYEKDLEPFL
jgi:hypothetical protein